MNTRIKTLPDKVGDVKNEFLDEENSSSSFTLAR